MCNQEIAEGVGYLTILIEVPEERRLAGLFVPSIRALWSSATFSIALDPDPALIYSYRMDYRDIITIEPDKRGGKPCIRGLRITVYDVLEYLAGGMSEEEILRDFPDLTLEDIRACIAFAADRERKLASSPPAA